MNDLSVIVSQMLCATPYGFDPMTKKTLIIIFNSSRWTLRYGTIISLLAFYLLSVVAFVIGEPSPISTWNSLNVILSLSRKMDTNASFTRRLITSFLTVSADLIVANEAR